MAESASSSPPKRRRWPWITLLALLILVGGLRLALKTTPVHRWVKGIAEQSLNDMLRPKLTIGQLSGDLWNSLTITDITLREDTVVASIDTLQLTYNPLSYFGDALEIRQVRIVRPFVRLRETVDSTLNVQQWYIAPEDTSSSSLAIEATDIALENGRIEAQLPSLQQDSSFTVDSLQAQASFNYYGSDLSTEISDFRFTLLHTRLDAPLQLQAAAGATSTSVSLEKLMVATGHSLFNANGQASLVDSTAHATASLQPLGWRDVAAYVDSMPVRQDINSTLQLNANGSTLQAQLTSNATGIANLELAGALEYGGSPALTTLSLRADTLNLAAFLGDETQPRLQQLAIEAEGRLPFNAPETGRMQATITARDIRQSTYNLPLLEGRASLENGQATLRLEPQKAGQRIVAEARAEQLFEDRPQLQLNVRTTNLNPARWLNDPQYDGSITLNASAGGPGWYPDEEFWTYRINATNSQFQQQEIDTLRASGRINQHRLTNTSRLVAAKNYVDLQAQVDGLQTMPAFTYTVDARNINAAEFGMADYPSSLNIALQGAGRGTSLEDLQGQMAVRIDSSVLKGSRIANLSFNAALSPGRQLSIPDGQLKSDIADGSFTAGINVSSPYATDNALDLDVQLKDLSPFASSAGVEVLQATGSISGRLQPTAPDSVGFKGTLELENVNYDNSFIAGGLSGTLQTSVEEAPRYVLDISVDEPQLSSINLQRIQLQTRGDVRANTTTGEYSISVEGEKQAAIRQQGRYTVHPDSTTLAISTFDLSTAARTLSLQKPFNVRYSAGQIATDTLHMAAPGDSVFVELAVLFADSSRQRGYISARRLNIGSLQNALINDAYVTGFFSGTVSVERTDSVTVGRGQVLMEQVEYEQTVLDTLRLNADVEKERLTGTLKAYQRGDLIAEGEADIPFSSRPPSELGEAFYNQPVRGSLSLNAVDLERFKNLLQQFGYDNTVGTLQFSSTLAGTAGAPEVEAQLALRNASLSSVPVDSLIAAVDYNQALSALQLNATLSSMGQQALEATATMPLEIDMQQLSVTPPAGTDEITATFTTNNFDLKTLNNFVDRALTRNIEGVMNGEVTISGQRSDLQTNGSLTLRKGAVRLVPAGIRLDGIKTTMNFTPDKLELANLSMNSGSGTLSAKGQIGLQQLVPGDVDISVQARNFKAANTEDYNVLVNLDAAMDGSITKPNLRGDLDIINGFLKLDNFGEKSVEQVQLDTTVSMEPDVSVYDSLSLDLDIGFNRRFFIRNQRYLEMEFELDGDIDVLKKPGGDLELFGTLNTPQGFARPLGKRFELEEGTVAFSGPPANPQLNIRTLYEPPQANQEVKIYYIIEGTVEDPQFKYESEPQMDLAGILSYTLFGQPFYKLNPTEQSVAGSSSNNAVTDFAMEVLLDRVEALATQRLGIDVVRIETTQVGGETGTAITTGWYINPKVFFAIQNVITGSSPTPGFFLEYYIRENLKLLLSQGNNNRQGVDLQWEYDY